MSTPPATHSLLSGHTFGRHHTQHQPLSAPLQQGQASQVAKMGGEDGETRRKRSGVERAARNGGKVTAREYA